LASTPGSTPDIHFIQRCQNRVDSADSLRDRFQFLPENQAITAQKFWWTHCDVNGQGRVCMLKISVVEGPRQRRMILEGKLIVPWVAELTAAYEAARANLNGRELIVDLTSLTAISPEGECVLLELMNQRVKFQCGVFMKEVLRQLNS
jgi:hypothetical protein